MMIENQIPFNSHKLINFNVPNYLITNFDELVKFKRISRTSMLIRLMESYVRNEVGRLKEDDEINHLIRDVKLRNHITPKKMMTVSAAVRLMPTPPARVQSRKTNRSESGFEKRSMAACRSLPLTMPSMRSYGKACQRR